MISLDDMHSENMWFSWSKPSDYQDQEKLRCHACDVGRTEDGRKVENSAVFWYTRNCKKIDMKLTIKIKRPIS